MQVQERALQLGAERENEVSLTHTLFSGQWDTSQCDLEQADLSSLFMLPEEIRCEWICNGLQSFSRTAVHVQLENQANILIFFITNSSFWDKQFLFRELQKISLF